MKMPFISSKQFNKALVTGIAFFQLLAISVFAQSTDVNRPTPLTSKQLEESIAARDGTEYFYSFIGGPGKVTLKLSLQRQDDFAYLKVDALDQNRRVLLTLEATSSDREKNGSIQLGRQQEIILRLQSARSSASTSYVLKIDGPAIFNTGTLASSTTNPPQPSAARRDTSPPRIEIHSPKTTRGQSAQVKTCNVTVEGQAIDESAIREVLVHNIRANVGEQGKFSASLSLNPGSKDIVVTATDIHGNTAQEKFTIACENVVAATPSQPNPQNSPSPSLSLPPGVMVAKQHALVIGINNYQNLSKLETAVNDAKDVARVLREEFGFEVKLLLDADATREKIMDALQGYEKSLKAGDRLLIYYAGHGYKDTAVNKAYWNPVNATTSRSSWISADDVTTGLRGISQAQQILIVSDSCYSGEMARSYDLRMTAPSASATERNNFLERTTKEKARILIASGGNEPVTDSGGGNHSIFAAKFLLGLRELSLKAFTASELFNAYINVAVGGNSDQLPRLGPLMSAGHDGGDFIFVRR